MVYLGMGARACKISRPLDAGFILFPFWVGLISVVPVPEAETEAEIPKYRMSEANIGVVTLSHKVVRLPMIMFMHTVGLVNSASQSAMEKNPYFCTSTKFHALFGRNTVDEIIFL